MRATLYVLTIGEFSTGSAQFTSNAGQSLVCVNNDSDVTPM